MLGGAADHPADIDEIIEDDRRVEALRVWLPFS
jgi:hypothetical protein